MTRRAWGTLAAAGLAAAVAGLLGHAADRLLRRPAACPDVLSGAWSAAPGGSPTRGAAVPPPPAVGTGA